MVQSSLRAGLCMGHVNILSIFICKVPIYQPGVFCANIQDDNTISGGASGNHRVIWDKWSRVILYTRGLIY